MNEEILNNFERGVFYHGTHEDESEAIAREGFRVWFHDPEFGRYSRGGNLGNGIYLTCNWRTAHWFGNVLLKVSMRPGTRILDSAVPPDGKTLDYLNREFGREILKKPAWEVIPKNKKLSLNEMVNLYRHHYQMTWEKSYKKDEWGSSWTNWRTLHFKLLGTFRSALIRYGFHGVGNPVDENGIVVFAEDRLGLVEVVTAVHSRKQLSEDFHEFASLADLKHALDCNLSARVKRLMAEVNERD